MHNELEGYVAYYKDSIKDLPFGVISDTYECKAIADDFPTKLKDFLVQIEDRRFYKHGAIDLIGIIRAIVENVKAGRIVQGGSSITQQLARSILKDNRKLISRKIKELIKAVVIESNNSKDEILNLYFNNIYFGKNIRGLRAASLRFFGKEVDRLTQSDFLVLIAILRGPNYYLNNHDKLKSRIELLSKVLYERGSISRERHRKNINKRIILRDEQLHRIKLNTIPFISSGSNNENKNVETTIEEKLQKFSEKFVLSSRYPVSIIAIRQRRVVAIASTYGLDYPFLARSNVGSTLKPFLYCHLRDNGISLDEKFEAYSNTINWDVKEASCINPQVNLQEALLYSNNNAFINACNKTGIESALKYLAGIFLQDVSGFSLASILGATRSGITLYELAFAYSNFFYTDSLTESKKECLAILNRIARGKLRIDVENAFLKTGTTNLNKERYAVLGNPELTFAVLRNENPINDESKEGGFLVQISAYFSAFFKSKTNYKWS